MPGCELRGFSNLLLAVTSTGSDQEDRLRKSGQLECNSSSYCLSHCLAHSLTHSLTHTHTHTHTHIHTHTHTHTSTHTHLYTHTLTHRQTHTPLHTHIHTHTHTQTDRHTHTHTHTHTLFPPSLPNTIVLLSYMQHQRHCQHTFYSQNTLDTVMGQRLSVFT